MGALPEGRPSVAAAAALSSRARAAACKLVTLDLGTGATGEYQYPQSLLCGLTTKSHAEPCRNWRLSLPALLPQPNYTLGMGAHEHTLPVATVLPQCSKRAGSKHHASIPASVGMLDADETLQLGRTLVASGASLLITGAGGCGKTHLLAHGYIPELREAGISYTIATPTLTTRQNLRQHEGCKGAITIAKLLNQYRKHESFFGITIPPNHAHAIIIDEISMADEMCYQMLCYIKYRRPLVRFVLVGDFSQLDPVYDDWLKLPLRNPSDPPRSYSTAAPLRDLTGGCVLRMTHSHRTEPGEERHLAACTAVRSGKIIDISAYPSPHADVTLMNICVSNAKCDEVNEKVDEMYRSLYKQRYPEVEPIVVPRYEKAKDARELRLVEGTRLLGRKRGGGVPPGGSADESRVYRKQLYMVNKVTKEELEVMTHGSGEPVFSTVKTEEASKLFRNGWALTIHCVQGTTIDEQYTIHQFHHPYMTNKSKYVALSRARRGAQVRIDASDAPADVLTQAPAEVPSMVDFRREYLDAEAWEELLARADELPAASRKILLKFAEGVRATTAGAYAIDTRYSTKTGRRCAFNTFTHRGDGCLQHLLSCLRKAVLGASGHDIDIRSAHPTLLLQYLRECGYEGDTHHLEEFVEGREAVYARIESELRACEQIDAARITQKALKVGVTRTMFLGRIAHWLMETFAAPATLLPAQACPTLVRLADDFALAAKFIAKRHPEAVTRARMRYGKIATTHKKNPVAGAVSEIMGGIEAEVVCAIEDCFVLDYGLHVRALIYDGLVVQHASAELPAGMLAAAEARVLEKTGYQITLVEKEMYGFTVDACIAECQSRVGAANAMADAECAHVLAPCDAPAVKAKPTPLQSAIAAAPAAEEPVQEESEPKQEEESEPEQEEEPKQEEESEPEQEEESEHEEEPEPEEPEQQEEEPRSQEEMGHKRKAAYACVSNASEHRVLYLQAGDVHGMTRKGIIFSAIPVDAPPPSPLVQLFEPNTFTLIHVLNAPPASLPELDGTWEPASHSTRDVFTDKVKRGQDIKYLQRDQLFKFYEAVELLATKEWVIVDD